MSKRNATSEANEHSVRTNAEFLLVQFNHPIAQLRRCADNCLTKLIDAFPFLLWNGRVIASLLNLIQALSRSVDEDPECRTHTLSVPNLPWTIQLQVSGLNQMRNFYARQFTRFLGLVIRTTRHSTRLFASM